MRTVTLLGRPGCHLCDDARAGLELLRRDHPFALEERDIESDPELLRAHLERIPVILVDSEEVSHLFLDPSALLRALDRVP